MRKYLYKMLSIIGSGFILSFLAIPVHGQNEVAVEDKESKIMVSETGVEYELKGWDSRQIYNPFSYTYLYWDVPIYEKKKKKTVHPVPVSEFDQVPVFTKACLEADAPIECTNEKLAEFVSAQATDYPDQAQYKHQEGLEYVSIVLDKDGNFAIPISVLSKDKPCKGCSDRAAEIISQTEGQWQPAILDGEPVKTHLTIPVRFKLIDVPKF